MNGANYEVPHCGDFSKLYDDDDNDNNDNNNNNNNNSNNNNTDIIKVNYEIIFDTRIN